MHLFSSDKTVLRIRNHPRLPPSHRPLEREEGGPGGGQRTRECPPVREGHSSGQRPRQQSDVRSVRETSRYQMVNHNSQYSQMSGVDPKTSCDMIVNHNSQYSQISRVALETSCFTMVNHSSQYSQMSGVNPKTGCDMIVNHNSQYSQISRVAPETSCFTMVNHSSQCTGKCQEWPQKRAVTRW